MNSSQRRVAHRAVKRKWPVGTRVETRFGEGVIAKHFPARGIYVGAVKVRRRDGSSLGVYDVNTLKRLP
jgi:hypothetical protein